MSKISRFGLAAGVAAALVASAANAQVRRPSTPHAAFNFIPFGGSQVCTMHQVFDSGLWSGPMEISALGFAVNDALNGQSYESDIVIKLGYTNKIPGVDTGSGGLDAILANNPSSPLTQVYNHHVNTTLMGSGTEDFQFILNFDTPFCYDPAGGNLLVEIFSSWTSGADLSVGRTSGSSESSRAYDSTRFGNTASPTTATRMDFYEGACSSGGPAILTYDIVDAARSGFGNWAHTYNGTIVDTGNFLANGISFTRANYSGGGGTLNDGSEGTGAGDTQLFANNNDAQPEITLHLDGTYNITSIKMFSFDSGNSIPGSIGECSVTIGNMTQHFVTIEQATNDDFIDLSNSPLSGICTDTVKLSRFVHDGRQNGLNELFCIGEIRLTGNACSPGFTLSATGTCPGQLTISWSGAAPNSTVALIFSFNTGNFVIPFGPCQGTVLGLGNNHIQLVGTFGSNANGAGSISRNAPRAACSRFIQMHDLPNCTTSNVVQLP